MKGIAKLVEELRRARRRLGYLRGAGRLPVHEDVDELDALLFRAICVAELITEKEVPVGRQTYAEDTQKGQA